AIPNNVDRAVADANDYMSSKLFKDSLVSDFTKGLLKFGVDRGLDILTDGASSGVTVITNPLIDKGVDALGRRYDQPGKPPPLTSQESVPFLMMALKECRDGDSSFGQKLCPEFDKRLNVDARGDTRNQPAVRDVLFQNEVVEHIKKIDPELAAI